ncbi:hypothetical protein [Burkholderia sp. THE68]|jgi:hypothetical protein|nr:hypothetical protein [Burkholderia sp. THE68]
MKNAFAHAKAFFIRGACFHGSSIAETTTHDADLFHRQRKIHVE